jgi:hypothetical protein
MPLKVPDLDDRNYSDLVAEALSMIPRYAPEWTNYNPSDPGITLIELLAYFTEMMLYRLNRVGRENKFKFRQLLIGEEGDKTEQLSNLSLNEVEKLMQATILELKKPQRAVTFEDYENLAREAVADSIRVHCCNGKNLEADEDSKDINRPGHISMIVVADDKDKPKQYEALIQNIRNHLEPKCLLTTRLHVVQPCYVWFSVNAAIHPRSGISWEHTQKNVTEKLNQFFNPFEGSGSNTQCWSFGRNLYLSEIYKELESVSGVDYVEDVNFRRLSLSYDTLSEDQSKVGIQIGIFSTVGDDSRLGTIYSTTNDRLIVDGLGNLIGIKVKTYELLRIDLQPGDIDEIRSF